MAQLTEAQRDILNLLWTGHKCDWWTYEGSTVYHIHGNKLKPTRYSMISLIKAGYIARTNNAPADAMPSGTVEITEAGRNALRSNDALSAFVGWLRNPHGGKNE